MKEFAFTLNAVIHDLVFTNTTSLSVISVTMRADRFTGFQVECFSQEPTAVVALETHRMVDVVSC